MYRRKYGKIYHLSTLIKEKCDDGKTITRKLRFTDSFRFMSASLSDLVDNMSGIFISKVYKKCMERKKIDSKCKFDRLKDNRLS